MLTTKLCRYISRRVTNYVIYACQMGAFNALSNQFSVHNSDATAT
jgi:hypothetical protein